MAKSAREMLLDVNPDAIPAPAPPEASNYREADVSGISCMFCSKFMYTGETDDGIPIGVCEQWEANVLGDHVSDAFADPGPPLDKDGNEIWEFSNDMTKLNELFFSGGTTEEMEDTDDRKLLKKAILRTGKWDVTPTGLGKLPKPLTIVKEGMSDPEKGIISLSEVVENFKAGAKSNVGIPLSDTGKDHHPTSKTKTNTGFVRDVWMEEGPDGVTYLYGAMEFTEPEVYEKVLRGTYADVSSGLPWQRRRGDKLFGCHLDHVVLTNDPFIDNLGPFEPMAFSDDGDTAVADIEVNTFVPEGHEAAAKKDDDEEEEKTDQPQGGNADPETEPKGESTDKPVWDEAQSYLKRRESVSMGLRKQLGLSADYKVEDIGPNAAVVSNEVASMVWIVPFDADGDELKLAAFADWKVKDVGTEEEEPQKEEEGSKTVEASSTPLFASSGDKELDEARRLRELRLGQSNSNKSGGSDMAKQPATTFSLDALDGVELSDEQRSALESVLNENQDLRKKNREKEADARIVELSDPEGEYKLGDKPGFLKLYRQIMLSDDGGPAMVLLSDDGDEKERLTGTEILDRALDALKGESGVELSDQHLDTGNNKKPPKDASKEKQSLEERVAAAKADLGID